ncbi:arylsulfatase [Vibrio sp. WJH972]
MKDMSASDLKTDTQKQTDPNIVYIILDDMGFSDWGAFGSEIKTPNIDQLAKQGLRYNNFHVSPLSSPTRASLLTGRESNTVGMGHVAAFNGPPERTNLQGRISHNAATIMQMLKENGYSTYGVGKYHNSPKVHNTPAGPFDYWPLAKGYDRYFGFLDGETDQFTPQLINGNETLPPVDDENYILNNDLIAHAKMYIADHASVYPDKPFFMNFAFGTSHSPIQVVEKYVDMYDGVYDKGWDVIRAERFERMKALGIFPADMVLPASDPGIRPWDSLSDEEKELYVRFMQVYAGFITEADEKIGELVSYLKKVGEYDNTIIVLLNDNGATDAGGPDGTDSFAAALAGGKARTLKDLYPKLKEIGGPNVAGLYPKGWAQVGNTPFKGYKGNVYEGGIRASLLISWPEGDFADKGKVRSQYLHSSDISATMLDIIDAEAPTVYKGIEQLPVTGVSLASTFNNAEAPEVRDNAFVLYQNKSYIYDQGWVAMTQDFSSDQWELYNVNEDMGQTTDVAAKYPAKHDEMKARFFEMTKEAEVPMLPFSPMLAAYIPKDAASARSSFKYYPEMSHIIGGFPPHSGSMTITVPISRDDKNDEGVLVALGDNIAGYTFYIKDEKLVYEYDSHGVMYKVSSDTNVPTGDSVVKYVFDRKSRKNGIGTLFIDDKQVGQGEIGTSANLGPEGMDVGKDLFLPVSKAYADEENGFAFSGSIDYVQFDVKPFMAGPPPGAGKPGAEGGRPPGAPAAASH